MSNPFYLIDTHVHLDSEEFDGRVSEVINRAKEVGVKQLLTVAAGKTVEALRAAISIAEQFDNVWASVGVHPHNANAPFLIEEVERLLSHPKVVALGEVGLDYYRDWGVSVEEQRTAFERQIGIAITSKKPLIIHSRNAGEECIETLSRLGAGKVGGVFHCYSEGVEFSERLRAINFLISVPGTLTFKKSEETRKIIEKIPLDQIMLETDGPYMAPEPYRGKVCESAFMIETAKSLATVKGVSLSEIAEKTTENARRLFGFPALDLSKSSDRE